MRSTSRTEPERLIVSKNFVQIRWNIIQSNTINEDGAEVEAWSYEYANAASADRDALIRAIIRDRYPLIDDEIAIINNALENPVEYQQYQEFRAFAKTTANEALQ